MIIPNIWKNKNIENQKILEYSRLAQYQSTQKWTCTSKESQFREIQCSIRVETRGVWIMTDSVNVGWDYFDIL